MARHYGTAATFSTVAPRHARPLPDHLLLPCSDQNASNEPARAPATSQLRATKRFSPNVPRCSPPKTPFCTLHNQHIAAQTLGMRFFANVQLINALGEVVGRNNR